MQTPETPWPAHAHYVRTGPLLLDLRFRRLECGDSRAELQQRVFDLLILFLVEPNTLHTRQALFQRLWPGVIVEDANLSQSIWLLRKALGERGKHWIRTVAKAGYVFEPPGAVDWLAEPPGDPAATHAAVDGNEGAPPPTSSAASTDATSAQAVPPTGLGKRRRSRRRVVAWATAAGIAALLAVGLPLGFKLVRERQAAAAVAPAKQVVALVELEDRVAARRWPARLLHDWLRWKLSSLPEVTLLNEAELAAHTDTSAPRLVLLSATVVPERPGTVLLRARVQQQGGEQRFERIGPWAQLPAMVDALSGEVMSQVAPARAKPWPALALEAPAAERFAQASLAAGERDWIAAARLFGETARLAPRFGLARLELARAQSRLTQASSAVAQMQVAQTLLKPVPADVAEVIQAERLAMEPSRYRDAEAAYARLATRYPERKAFLLEQARLLVTSAEPTQALALLKGADWSREPLGSQIERRLIAANINLSLGDLDAVRTEARAAEQLAREAGKGWEPELANALIKRAHADSAQFQGSAGTDLYQRAARLLDLSGDKTGALYARFLAESVLPPSEAGRARLNALLAKAREGGYPRLEIGILQTVSSQYRDAGEVTLARRYLEQAWTTAQTAGDTIARDTLDMLLAGEDLSDLRLASADARLLRLQAAAPQGARAMLVTHYRAALAGIRGQPAAAVQILDRAEQQFRTHGKLPLAFSRLNCSRAYYRLTLGELPAARADWKRCAAPEVADQLLIVALGRAQTELLAGDGEAARALLEPLDAAFDKLPDGPDRWALSLEQAALLTRAGEPDHAARLYARLAGLVSEQGGVELKAALETGLAENDAALGRWDSSQAHAAAAERLLPPDAWAYRARLRLVDAVAARAAGDEERAMQVLDPMHAQAHRRQDQTTLLELHSLLPDGYAQGECTRAQRERLVARTGMRGAGAGWLLRASNGAPRAPLVEGGEIARRGP